MVTILAIRADGQGLTEPAAADLPRLLEDPSIHVWVDLGGESDEASLHVVRDIFHFHPLAIEDCFGAREHPKVEAYDSHLYVITHGLAQGSTARAPETIELDAFLGKRYLVTYHAQPSRSIAGVIDMVRRGGDPLRPGPAHVLYAILERQAEGIEPVIDAIDDHIAELEERVLMRPRPADLALLLDLRRSILQLRRWMTKQRDVMMRLSRNEFALVGAHEALLFRDVYDHLHRFTDLLENYRELTTSVQEAYLTMASNRLNEIMKFLTVFTATLMPLTVIAGIYGMNFEHMPELRWKWGYPLALAAMAATALGMIGYFRRKGWLGRDPGVPADEVADAKASDGAARPRSGA
jgi:magnesium transporter